MKIGIPAILTPAPVGAALNVRKDVQEVCDELGPGVEPLPHLLRPEQALDLKAPTLDRPVLLVHGLAQQADTWVNMKNYLCSNPENHYGGVYRPGQDIDFYLRQMDQPYAAKVFVLNLSDSLASPAETGQEVQEALSKIRGATGHTKIDVVTHSMGAFQARQALRQGEDAMANLVMIAPPSQGAFGANLLLTLGKIGLDRYPEDKNGALEALRLGGDYVEELNEGWLRDKQRLNSATIITGVGLPTPDKNWKGATDGDGMVAVRRAGLPETPMFVAGDNGVPAGDPNFRDFQMFRYNHLQIVSEAEVYQQVGQILQTPLAGKSADQGPGKQLDLHSIDPNFPPRPDPVEDEKDSSRQASLF